MMGKEQIIDWLNTLPEEACVGVDDGGLCLRVDCDPEAYLEIGGMPEEDEEDGDDVARPS
jgi:hypothetical protein